MALALLAVVFTATAIGTVFHDKYGLAFVMELAFLLLIITATVIKELSTRSNPQAALKQKQR